MAIKEIMTYEQMKASKQNWLDVRKNYIGGSEAAVLMGDSPWRSPFQLWSEKTGRTEPPDLSKVLRVTFGNMAEGFVADLFTQATGKPVKTTGVWVNDKYPWASASIDRMLDTKTENTFLELKTTAVTNKYKWDDNKVPIEYYWQVLHYMTVLEVDYCYVGVMFGNGDGFEIRQVFFDQEDADLLMETEEKFWRENLQMDRMPPQDGTVSCGKTMDKVFCLERNTDIKDLSELQILLEDHLKYKEEAKRLEKVIQESENKIREAMNIFELGFADGIKVTYKPRNYPILDKKALAVDYPNILSKYTKDNYKKVLLVNRMKAKGDK